MKSKLLTSFISLGTLLGLISCSDFVKTVEPEAYFQKIDNKLGAAQVSIIFGHNINGETHPCGCRHFPLGGTPQVAGAIAGVEKTRPTLYVDSGDTLFPSANLPKSVKKSMEFIAWEIVDNFNKLGLDYFTPGDQDFALGEQFLIDVAKKAKFTFLVNNFKKSVKIPHKKWVRVKLPNKTLFLTGTINPETMLGGGSHILSNSIIETKKVISQIKKEASKDDVIVVLSHSGMDNDEALAKAVPEIDWIIGAHTQNFLRSPNEQGKTKIVQVLSRNHYLGQINLNLSQKGKDTYQVLEMREEQKDKLKPNPFVAKLDKHKQELKKIQIQEEDELDGVSANSKKRPTYISCKGCHTNQTEFWQSTAHSLAWQTLRDANEERNPKCITCHSLGYKKDDGFMSAKTLVLFEDKKTDSNKYWQQISKIFKKSKITSVRDASKKMRKVAATSWEKLDEQTKASHNFANVQCLHCHNKTMEHPFDSDPPKKIEMKSNCISCHNPDQSPHWYTKDEKGLTRKLSEKIYKQKLKLVQCPKG